MKPQTQLFDNQNEKVALRFKKVREALNLQQGELAKKAGIHQSQVSEIEKGVRNITAEILLKMEVAFNTNWRYIGRGEGAVFLNEQSKSVNEDPASYEKDTDNWKEKYYLMVEKNASLSEKYTALLESQLNSGDNADKRNAG